MDLMLVMKVMFKIWILLAAAIFVCVIVLSIILNKNH